MSYPPNFGISVPSQSNNIHPDFVSDAESEDEDDSRSKIILAINTPLTINGNSNTVSIDMAANAGKISLAVVSALRQICAVGGGIPMINENGVPRPLDVKVTAEVQISGDGNVVGDNAVFDKLTNDAKAMRNVQIGEVGVAAIGSKESKRERSHSSVMNNAKKVRRE